MILVQVNNCVVHDHFKTRAKHSVTSWLWCHETDCIDQEVIISYNLSYAFFFKVGMSECVLHSTGMTFHLLMHLRMTLSISE